MPQATTVDVTALVSRQPFGRFHLRLIVLGIAVLILDGFDGQIMGYVAPALSRDWHLAPGALGPVFAAGLFGLLLGAILCGWLADVVGRRAMVIACTAAFGALSLATLLVHTLDALVALRFVTGLVLGGAMPNATALMSEYMPPRRRIGLAALVGMGFSLGSALGGFVAAFLIPRLGWTGVFWVGGVLPLLLTPVLWAALPESVRFLCVRRQGAPRIARTLAQIDPVLQFPPGTVFAAEEERSRGFLMPQMFTEGRAAMTTLVWIVYFAHGATLNFIVNWMPTLMHDAGISMEGAASANALFQVGGILGGIVLGFMIDRLDAVVLSVSLLASAVLIALIGQVGLSYGVIAGFAFAAGACVVGTQGSANAFTGGALYPTFIRSTGLGWALGMSRLGGVIAGSFGGAWLLRAHMPLAQTFLIGAVPEVVAALAMIQLARLRSGQAALGADDRGFAARPARASD